ncbi:prolyl-tRNA synthetase [Fusarium proliferatum]|nr:prolyl-tRNA synthetase [Fusarium proliferatum]
MSNQKPAEIIGITAMKEADFPQWYQEVVVKAGMVEYYTEIAGLFVLRLLTMFIWSGLRKWFQGHLDGMDIGETAFPLFLSAKSLAKEKDHIEGFEPELAWPYEDLLAVPIVRGRKTENERFAEGYYTLTLEGYIPSNGRGIQGATSHCLGQSFSKMFDISVEDPAGPGRIYAWQNSWAFSTRVIGVMVMIHGDNKDLVLPPRVSQTQIVMVPVGIIRKTKAEDKDRLLNQLYEMRKTLKKSGLRVEVDTHAKTHVVSYAARHNNKKGTMPVAEIAPQASRLLDQIQKDMYVKANLAYSQHRKVIDNWEEVSPALDSKNMVLIPFCLDGTCEDRVKQLTTKEDDLGDQELPQWE